LDSAVNPIPARAACRLTHSCPLSHYAAAAIMSGTVGWAMRERWSGAVCQVIPAA